jgi:hypothetical protein
MEAEKAYQILEEQCFAIDKSFTKKIKDNSLIQLLKSGIVYKKSERMAFGRWVERFLILTNCGLIYFKKG